MRDPLPLRLPRDVTELALANTDGAAQGNGTAQRTGLAATADRTAQGASAHSTAQGATAQRSGQSAAGEQGGGTAQPGGNAGQNAPRRKPSPRPRRS